MTIAAMSLIALTLIFSFLSIAIARENAMRPWAMALVTVSLSSSAGITVNSTIGREVLTFRLTGWLADWLADWLTEPRLDRFRRDRSQRLSRFMLSASFVASLDGDDGSFCFGSTTKSHMLKSALIEPVVHVSGGKRGFGGFI